MLRIDLQSSENFDQRLYWKRLWTLQQLNAGEVCLPGADHAEPMLLCGISMRHMTRSFIAIKTAKDPRQLAMSLGDHVFCTRILGDRDRNMTGVFYEHRFEGSRVKWKQASI